MQARWYVLGAGAIGCLWAANLKRLNFPVTLLLRSQTQLDDFSATQEIKVDEHRFAVDADSLSTDMATDTAINTPIQQLLITTKSTDTEAAVNSIRHRLDANARIIVLQNGMGPQHWVAEQFPDAEVIWGSTTDGAWRKSAFEIVHAGQGVTKLGSPRGKVDWLESFKGGFLEVEIDHQIETTLWQKLAINCAINPLTAIAQCQNGELVRNPDHLAEMTQLCAEVEQVINTAGISLFSDPLIEHARKVAELTAQNYSSMMQDIRHQRKTEIEHITGYLCRTAKTVGISVPANQKIYDTIKQLEKVN